MDYQLNDHDRRQIAFGILKNYLNLTTAFYDTAENLRIRDYDPDLPYKDSRLYMAFGMYAGGLKAQIGPGFDTNLALFVREMKAALPDGVAFQAQADAFLEDRFKGAPAILAWDLAAE